MKVREYLCVTDDPEQMTRSGELIWINNPDIYNDRRRTLLGSTLDAEMPDTTAEQKELMLYRSIYDYWMYGISLKEEFSLRFYEKKHEEKENYISFRNRFQYTSHLNDYDYAYHLLEDKYNCFLKYQPFYKRDVVCIETEDDYPVFEQFVKKHPTFVVKPALLAYGWGVHKQTISPNEQLHDVFMDILQEGSAIQEKHHITADAKRFVLEELIDQSDKLGCLHPFSVNCVRLTTIVIDGNVHFFYPRLKVGRNGNFISNAGDDGLLVGVETETGILETDAGDEFGNIYEYHPNSKIRFKGFQIPDWDELLQLGEQIALEVAPRVKYIGWDMAYTNSGWSILEANAEGEFGAQFIYQKGLKKELEELIHWKPSEEFWWEDPVSTKIG